MDELIQRIEAGDASVIEDLRALPSRCVHDERLTTPLAAAIRAGNGPVVAALLEDPDVLEYRPDLPDDVRTLLGQMTSSGVGQSVERIEAHLLEHGFAPVPHFERTPLMEACRWGNAEAVAALVERGASTEGKDAIQMDALELALATGDEALVETLVRGCAESGTAIPVSDIHLEEAAQHPALWDLLVEHGTLRAPAERLAFNAACARLDMDEVERWIADGFTPDRAVTTMNHPAVEAATSHLAWSLGMPDFDVLAPGLAHIYGHPDGTSMSSEDLVDEDGNEISWAVAEARRLRRNKALKREGPDPVFVSDEQLERRLALLELLAEHGAEPGKYRGDVDDHLVATNRPELVAALQGLGFRFDLGEARKWALSNGFTTIAAALDEKAQPAGKEPPPLEATWELAGESMATARFTEAPAAGECTVQVIHDNVYGPVDGTRIFVRLGDPDEPTPWDRFDGPDGWTPTEIVEETVLLHDLDVPRDEVDEIPPDGAPWRAVHQAVVTLPSGEVRLEVAVVSETYPDLDGVLSDWTIEVP